MSKLTDYKPLQRNPNKGTQRGTGILEQSVRELGAGRSILVDKNGVILAGNHAQEAFINAGIDNVIEVETDGNQVVVVKRTDLDADSSAGKKMAIMDNRTSEQGLAWDAVVVEDLLNEIKDDEGELDAYLESLAKDTGAMIGDEPPEDAGAQIDKAEELRVKWGVELGQLWQLGEHRLICGDCTDLQTIDILMNKELAVCMWTDPPYGVDYVGKTKDALTIQNDGKKGLSALLHDSFSVAHLILDNGAGIYIAHPPGELSLTFGNTFISIGWKFHETLVWVKDSMVLGHSDYHYKHEPIIYGWKGQNRKWVGGRDKTTVFEIPRPKRSEEHPTMKPIELVEQCLQNSTDNNDIVYDPFLGSGTTLIACERLNRKCRAVEISPAYCAVAIQRWVDMTGQEPVLLTP